MEKKKNFFARHKIITVLLVLFVLGIIGSLFGDDEATKNDANATNQPVTTDDSKKVVASDDTAATEDVKTEEPEATEEVVEEPKIDTYIDGTYMVETDIPAGLYKVKLTDTFTNMGYVERAKDVDMELESIIANILLTGDGYVEILDTDTAVRLQGVELTPIDLKNIEPDIKKEAADGIYLIGYDLAPGTYKVEVTDEITKMGYVERSKSVAMGMDDIIANEIIENTGYVKIKESDFAVRLQGVKISLSK